MQLLAPVLVCILLFSIHDLRAQTVTETVMASLDRHPELSIERLELKQQKLALTQVEADYLPRVTLAAGIGREDSNNTSTRSRVGGSEEMERKESSVSVRQMLFDGFDTHWRQQGQEAEIQAAEVFLLHTATRVAVRAIEAHLDVVLAKQRLDFNVENYQSHQQIADGIRVRVESGKDDRAKVAQVNARVALAQSNVETAKAMLLQSQARYFESASDYPAMDLKAPKDLPALPETLEVLRLQVLQDNALLQSKMLVSKAAEKRSRASKSTFYPDVYVDAGASWNDNLDGVTGRNNDAYALLRLSYELYQGGSKSAARKQAGLARQRASLELDLAQRQVLSEAEQFWFALKASERQVNFLADYVRSAAQTQEAYQKQFDIGQRSLIDLLDAENELLVAREKWLEAQREWRGNVFKLSALAGQLLDKLAIPLDLNKDTKG